MFQSVVLSVVQGIVEWLPVSSEGFLVLVDAYFFSNLDLSSVVEKALFLHFGTCLAALVYFRKEVYSFLGVFWSYGDCSENLLKEFNFLVVSSLISGIFGVGLLKVLSAIEANFKFTGSLIMGVVGALLIITGIFQIKSSEKRSKKMSKDLHWFDGILLGLAQGLAVLPGFSRSGFTVSALLLRGFEERTSLRLSFLMSLPIVFFGNLILNFEKFVLSWSSLMELGLTFLFGFLTIDLLLKAAHKFKFGWFVLGFGFLALLSSFL